jgi:hypothetical protein
MINMNKCFLIFVTSILLVACVNKQNSLGVVDAYKPIYGNPTEFKTYSQIAPKPIVNGGKIAKAGQLIYQVEEGKGIHIIDVSNPAIPVKKSFLNIPFCNEVTLKGNFLYTNNSVDLLALNVSDINTVTLASRTANAFPSTEFFFPPQTGVYFECADPSKGVVVGWELTKIDNPKCRR